MSTRKFGDDLTNSSIATLYSDIKKQPSKRNSTDAEGSSAKAPRSRTSQSPGGGQKDEDKSKDKPAEDVTAMDEDGPKASGKGGGKRGGRRNAKKVDLKHMVEDIRISVSRLLIEDQRNNKGSNLIAAFAPGAPVREFLGKIRDSWHEKKPEPGDGPHPHGDLHLFVWKIFLHHLSEELGPKAGEHPRTAGILAQLLNDNGRSLLRFFPLSKGGRSTESDQEWLWQIRFCPLSQEGGNLHRILLNEGLEIFKIFCFIVRPDHCPMHQAGRRVQNGTVL